VAKSVAIFSLKFIRFLLVRDPEATDAPARREPDVEHPTRSAARALGGIPPPPHWNGEGGGANFAG